MSGYLVQAFGSTYEFDPSDRLYELEPLYTVASTTITFADGSGSGGPDTSYPQSSAALISPPA